eukprot:14934869-Alexandrium_andersonii.AAC.1
MGGAAVPASQEGEPALPRGLNQGKSRTPSVGCRSFTARDVLGFECNPHAGPSRDECNVGH